ncbi:hypothetical protein BKA69DRAFT_83695 [Paraphysoderma sedebokerense]|nr:hypothetical protein BKA69DRAFT_83695 [Paraphysoderma sedebokerense]
MSGSSPLSTSSSFKAWKLIYDPDLDKSITSKSEKKTKTKIKRFNGQIPGQSSIKPKDPRLDNPNYGAATSRGKKKYLERLAKDLLDAFSKCGEVICVRLVTANKRFTGLASVKFRHEGEASDALRRMNGFILDKSRLKVELDVDGSNLQSQLQAMQKSAKSLSEDSKSRHYRRDSLESSDMDISDDDDTKTAKLQLNRVHDKHTQHSGYSTNQPALRPTTPTSNQRHGEERTHRLPHSNNSDGKHPDYTSHQYYGQQVGTPSRHYPSSSYYPRHNYHFDDPDSKRYSHYDFRESDFYSESNRQGGRAGYSQPDRYSSSSYKSHEYSSSQEQHGRSRYSNEDNRKHYDDDWRSERRSERWSTDDPDATRRRENWGYTEDENRRHHRESRYYEGSKSSGHSSSRYDSAGKAPRTPPRPPTDQVLAKYSQESLRSRPDESIGKESYYRDSQRSSRKVWTLRQIYFCSGVLT